MAVLRVSVGGWFAFATFAFLAALATRNLRPLWHGAGGRWAEMPAWWVRGLPTAVAVGWLMLVGAALSVFAVGSHGRSAAALAIVLGVVLLGIAIGVVMWVCVALIEWPRFAVPPPYRRRRASGQ